MRIVSMLVGAIIIFAAGYLAAGFMPNDGMAGMDHSGGAMVMGVPKGDQGASSTAYAKVNADMHSAMDIEFSGNSDKDFARGMIAHHQGAVEMAKVQLQYGTDAEMRALAEAIIAAQQPEIDQMHAWLAKNP